MTNNTRDDTARNGLVEAMGDVEKVARLISPENWAVMDSHLARTKRKYAGENVMWPTEQFQDTESMRKAHSIVDLFDSTLAARDARIETLEAQHAEDVKRNGELVEAGQRVMDMLAKHGPSVVPHLLDTDDNAGERFRAALQSPDGKDAR